MFLELTEITYIDVLEGEIQNLHNLVKKISWDIEISQTDFMEWLTGKTKSEFKIKSDAEIINMTLQNESKWWQRILRKNKTWRGSWQFNMYRIG